MLVVSIEQAVAAPLCSCRLLDLGARVLKIERPSTGDFARSYDNFAEGSSSYFSWLNRGKESITLDLSKNSDLRALKTLISKSDIFVQNLKPGSLNKFGLNSSDLRRKYNSLLTVDISGYPDLKTSEKYSKYKAYDLLVSSEAGLCQITGTETEAGRVGVSICDILCGKNAFEGVLASLLGKSYWDSIPQSRAVKSSLFGAVSEVMNVPLIQQRYTDKPPKRAGLSHPSIAPYGCFSTKDNKKILIAVQNEREWQNLATKILKIDDAQSTQFEGNANRVKHRVELDETIQNEFIQVSSINLKNMLLEHDIAFGELNELSDVLVHPMLQTITCINEFKKEIEIIYPEIFSPEIESLKVPMLGEHTHKIKEEFDL
eukprot:augustus_masked-scaffold_11-processed-gene-2.39-mRNA-1 protein AED:0.29 eAED:0.30 QI:0/-1/0/1/-1/1/1/0/372